MPKYMIEREIPGAGKMTPQQLRAVAEKSCAVLNEMGPRIQWNESFVTGDKLYCVYIAPSEEAVREHARLGGFPANRISEIKAVIDPATAGPADPAKSQPA
jgi:Nickel responsive protein SCO4226-like